MKLLHSWSLLTVEEFFLQGNWQGHPLRSPSPSQTLPVPPRVPGSQPYFWHNLKVEDFLRYSNWQGYAPPAPSLESAAVGVTEAVTVASDLAPEIIRVRSHGLCLSVAEFFGQSYWQGQPSLSPIQGSAPVTPSLDLSVGQFFQGIAWEGHPQIAALPPDPPLPEPPPSDPTFTLTDLTDLF